MVGEVRPVEVDVNSADEDFWRRYHEFRRARQSDERPDDPVRPDEQEELRMKHESPFQAQHHFELSRDGLMLSWFGCQTVTPESPEYATNKHLLWAGFYVRREHRRMGLGTSWLPVLAAVMDRHGCTTASLGAEEESGHAFLKWTGAEARLTGAENRLKVADLDWEMVRRWVKEGEGRSPSTKLEIYDGPLPESMWEEFAPQFSTMLNTIPMENLDVGDIVVTPDLMRVEYERDELAGNAVHLALTREPDGTISAISDVSWAPYRPKIVHQRFTGVLPSARGRGLGKWIKAAMLLHLKELYPDFQWVATDNAGSNAPMLAINNKLGFKQYRAATEYQITLDRLAARLRSLGTD
jgi:mycothiol synthase